MKRSSFVEDFQPRISAECLFPAKLAGRVTQMTIIGTRDYQDWRPRDGFGVGILTMRGKVSEFLGSAPSDALHSVMPMIAAGKCRFVYLTGEPLFRGEAKIKSLWFDDEMDLDQLARDCPELAKPLAGKAGRA